VDWFPLMAHSSSLLLSDKEIRDLVPGRLLRRRDERYMGGALHGSLDTDFSEEEVSCLRALYADLGELMGLAEEVGGKNLDGGRLQEFTRRSVLISAVADLEKFEQAAQSTYDSRMANLFRELTDGPVASLCAIMLLISSVGAEPEYFRTLFYLARDQRKIMRSMLVDLDPELRAKDEAVNVHSIDLLLEKWRDTVYRAFDAELDVSFETTVEGMVAERCIEFAEVDRLFYHLVNNALRHGSEKKLSIQAVDADGGEDLIWVFSNPVSKNQAARLQNFSEGRQSVFEFGVGDGSGVGLGSLAESVAHAYGMDTAGQAVSGGYVGTVLDRDVFRIWFHWPKA